MVRLMLWLLTSFFLFFTNPNHVPYDADFHSPIGTSIILAANFGEVRSNHFHTGIDIKTNGQKGFRIYAVADGYVSRIKVSPYGYGRVVYVNHPQLGLTTVYAHCSDFVQKIDSILIRHQQKHQQSNVDFNLKPHQIPVKKGQQIALSGNSGGSSGPHLHFEIRDMFTEHPYNPLLFDFFDKIEDHRKPVIRRIKVYALNKDGVPIPGISSSRKVHRYKGKIYIAEDLWTIPANFCSQNGGIGFSVDAIDLLDAAYNRCGFYESALLVNGDTAFCQNMAELNFSTNRYINSHVDHQEFIYHGRMLQKQFKSKYNQLDIFPVQLNGVLSLQPDSSYKIQYICKDAKGNRSALQFELKIQPGAMRKDQSGLDFYASNYMYPDSSYFFKASQYEVQFPAHILYRPIEKNCIFDKEKLHFGDSDTPLNDVFRLRFKVDSNTDTLHSIFVVESKNGQQTVLNTRYKDGFFYTEPKRFGTFYLVQDTISPEVNRYNFDNNETLSNAQKLKWRVRDDFSGIHQYQLYIDGKWQALYFDYKNDVLETKISNLSTGKHILKLIVEDLTKNSSVYRDTIVVQ